ncbi:lipase family protein [Halalkalibacter krulwichiae]|uniref:Lipase (Class 3) n=1 Tax=Halalkalibacter krulwichiae TaxID=199441 RepID=A0A1X9MFA7_9BACI|nr:lipase family protein [Halalkalibacter krulwichiae]ARK30201.1 Lipase (class 3) [Halalkalibacter krulwichiae]
MDRQEAKLLPLFLANCCLQTYKQYEMDGAFTKPIGYKNILSFKALAMGKEEWFGFILESKKNIIIAFRGTESNSDWIIDAEVSQQTFPYTNMNDLPLVHAGFLTTYSSCREAITHSLKNVSRSKPIYVTGHSLGAALATICALDLACSRFNTSLFTFASPRVGNDLFSTLCNIRLKQSERYVNIFDIVPLLPPEEIYCPITDHTWRYKHVQQERSFGLQTESLDGNHSIYTYLKGVKTLCE